MTNITIDTVVAPDLDITDLTTIDLKGTGVWDKLLQTMRVQLDEQFHKNRITGPSYGQVYAATYDSTLQAAISFLLAKERQALEFKQLELQSDLTQAQIDQIHDQMQKTPYEIEQIQAQTANIAKDTELKDYQLTALYPAQLEQANKQIELLEAQIDVQKEQLALLREQVEQAKAQTDYYAQKTITEKAQTDSSVIGSGSVIDVQVELMNAQKDGYKRNAEQQAAQIMSNTWNVRRQTDEDTSANTTNLLDDATVGKAIQKLLAGIDVTVSPA
ncbi:TPA: hypothetical protein MCM00_003228 [Klebsiella pneumoniae]|nr:hypothetical protein [Klebsiella pneumoniae]